MGCSGSCGSNRESYKSSKARAPLRSFDNLLAPVQDEVGFIAISPSGMHAAR